MLRWLKQEVSWLGSLDLWMALAASAIAALMIIAASEAQAQTCSRCDLGDHAVRPSIELRGNFSFQPYVPHCGIE